MVKATVAAFRVNSALDTSAAITSMGIGEALVSVMSEGNIPSPVERVRILPPRAQVGPISSDLRSELLQKSEVYLKFSEDLPDFEQAGVFRNRMLVKRGFQPITTDLTKPPVAANWTEILSPYEQNIYASKRHALSMPARIFLGIFFTGCTLIAGSIYFQ
jgi:hypothetical protein